MIHADRTRPLTKFEAYVEMGKPNNWDDFVTNHHDLYVACRTELLHKQGGVSSYTEYPLKGDGNIHIDHFRKKGIPAFRSLMFAWTNFIVDQRNNPAFGAGHKDRAVSAPADYTLLIDPVAEPHPERYFSYMENGEMIPAPNLSKDDKPKAEYTIKIFNLNHPILCKRRVELFRLTRSYGNALSSQEIRQALAANGFPTAVAYALGA